MIPETDSRPCERNTNGDSCGATSCTGFGGCGGFDTTCDESGTQSRTCTDYTCNAGSCRSNARTESQSCGRDTDGTQCASTTCTNWGACGEFTSTCDEAGRRSRTCTDHACVAGSCGNQTRTERESCERNTDGVECMPKDCSNWFCDYATHCSYSGDRWRECKVSTCDDAACITREQEEDGGTCHRVPPGNCPVPP